MSGAVCAWVRVRGEGGMGDRFSAIVVQWLLRSCQSEDEGGEDQLASYIAAALAVCVCVCVCSCC